MEESAVKIQKFYREKKTTDKVQKKDEKAQKKDEKVSKKYDRGAEKDQEIGEEFMNPDEDMDKSALKIQ